MTFQLLSPSIRPDRMCTITCQYFWLIIITVTRQAWWCEWTLGPVSDLLIGGLPPACPDEERAPRGPCLPNGRSDCLLLKANSALLWTEVGCCVFISLHVYIYKRAWYLFIFSFHEKGFIDFLCRLTTNIAFPLQIFLHHLVLLQFVFIGCFRSSASYTL